MIWMGNDLSLINDWETYLKGIHLQHGMGSLLRWTGALERVHVLPPVSVCPDASLRERVWDVTEVPESIPLSPLSPPGNEMRSDVDSSPPPVYLCSHSLFLSIALHLFLSPPFVFLFGGFPHCPVEPGCEMLDCSIYLVNSKVCKRHEAVSRI